jgi:outer membrane lipoprotein-sorting protein
MSNHLRSRLVAAALLSALLVSACGQEDAASYLAKAKGHL